MSATVLAFPTYKPTLRIDACPACMAAGTFANPWVKQEITYAAKHPEATPKTLYCDHTKHRYQAEYLSCAVTAKYIRRALATAFPGIKFSVRSDTYSMGASIRIHWNDGPTTKAVDEVVGVYAGADFDGMIDLKSYKAAWLEPDGTATFGQRDGTEGSRGVIGAYDYEPPSDAARLVHWGADYVFTSRTLSQSWAAAEHAAGLHDRYSGQQIYDCEDCRADYDNRERCEWPRR